MRRSIDLVCSIPPFMAEALDPAAYIHEGFWTNWSKGSITGRTLTLSPTWSTLLTNSLALFVTLSGGQLWTVLRFSLHQYRASRIQNTSNALRRQEQVVLRNATTNFATLRLMSQVAWAFRRSSGRPFIFCLLIVILALVHAVFFMIAGAFSNNVANAGQEVLSRSHLCGVWNETYLDIAAEGLYYDSPETLNLSVEYFAKVENNVQLSLEYAQQCYLPLPHNYMSSACNSMKNSTITSIPTLAESCPFAENLCHSDAKSLVFDTGPVDSHRHLGINAKPKDRLTYQRFTTCAVLNDTGRVTGWNGTIHRGDIKRTAYARYGPSLLEGTHWTYSYSNFASFFDDFTPQVTQPYQVSVQRAYAGAPDSGDFQPIPELQQESADLSLVFLSFVGGYTTPITDPWFSALHSQHVDAAYPLEQTPFMRERAISTIGCTEQHQFCTKGGICTPFSGVIQLEGIKANKTDPFISVLSLEQQAAFDRILKAAEFSTIPATVPSLALTSTPLLAMSAVANGGTVLSLPLPNYQWQKELEYWQSIAMAQLQRVVVQWGTGQIAAQPQYLVHPPPDKSDQWFCKNVMILSTVYQSFNVLALGLIIGCGGLVILISLTIEDTAAWVERRAWKITLQRDVWDEDDMLRLQPRPPRKSHRPMQQQPVTVVHQSPISYSAQPDATRVFREAAPNFSYPQPQVVPCHARSARSVDHYTVSEQSMARMWSDLPAQPARDSWLERDINIIPDVVASPTTSHLQDRDLRGSNRQEMVETTRPARKLELFGLRDHALARIRGNMF